MGECEAVSDSVDGLNTEESAGCKHYKRNCRIKSPCCGKIYTCRFCHDDEENHDIIRKEIKEVQCMNCLEVQECSQKCKSCEQIFGNYFCDICHFYDNVDRKQFHCEKCGICRIGGQENFFHCETCDMCLSMEMKTNHKCLENASKNNCPICLEDLHTSTRPSHIPHCSHMIHRYCFLEMLKNGSYACPVCAESMVKMDDVWRHLDEEVADTPMPEDYQNTKVKILCRDCHKECEVLFHVLGLKCQSCGSYNTCRTGSKAPTQDS